MQTTSHLICRVIMSVCQVQNSELLGTPRGRDQKKSPEFGVFGPPKMLPSGVAHR